MAGCIALVATTALGQFVDNVGQAGSADTSAFGQQAGSAFSPATDQVRNGGLGVRILFVGRNAVGKTLTISSEFQNVNEMPIFVALVGPEPSAIDTQGVTYELQKMSGLPHCRDMRNSYLAQCFENSGGILPGAAFTRIEPGASAILAMTFSAEQTIMSGFLSVAMNVALATGTRPNDKRASGEQPENVAISFPLIALEGIK